MHLQTSFFRNLGKFFRHHAMLTSSMKFRRNHGTVVGAFYS